MGAQIFKNKIVYMCLILIIDVKLYNFKFKFKLNNLVLMANLNYFKI